MTLPIHSHDELVSLVAAARELGRSRPTLKVWVLEGRLPARRVEPRGWVTTRAAVNAFKAAHPELVRAK